MAFPWELNIDRPYEKLTFPEGGAGSESTVSMNQLYPFHEAQAAYDRMMSEKARFRVVLTMSE